ncbi:MAG: ArsR family transcriptional regulator [Nitrosopumilales archaeon CG15_BIG_FIL_POST_REV_8_21_14_020_33_23]|nr:MAG: ArsR family transcriptional regulator [Nitrosopumilales archaeon CG15_BIG_FIL_POST_REV_8_21_14_020_33_23]PJB97823.1 MAG: ArsR family transcriptional regulator [Nitrosopumilales archaeon CG_4_9_14_0_8_um_filter_34_10]
MDDASEIFSTLSDEQSREIIKLVSKTEFTIQQISNMLNIPLSTTYRKTRKLEELEIIKKTKVIRTLEGLDESYYKNWIYEIVITYRDGELSYKLEHVKIEDKIVRLWQKFSE